MTRTQSSASPTTSRAWRAIAALTLSLVLAPAAMADEPTTAATSAPLPLQHLPPRLQPVKPRPRCYPNAQAPADENVQARSKTPLWAWHTIFLPGACIRTPTSSSKP